MIILHNVYDKDSVAFVKKYYDPENHILIDWYNDKEAVKDYISADYQPPGSFPAIVDEKTRIIKNKATTINDLQTKIDYLNSRTDDLA